MLEQCVLSCKALGACLVTRVSGREAMGELSRFEVHVLAEDRGLDLTAVLGADAILELGDGESSRPIPLVVAGAAWAGAARDGHRYAISLAPRAHVLELRHGHEIFQEKTTQEIVKEVLERAGITGAEVSFRLAGQYQKRVYCVRYAESEWQFLVRLCADEGINVWFDSTEQGDPIIVFGDNDTSHSSIAGNIIIPFEDGSGMVRSPSFLVALERAHEVSHDHVHVRDFDVRHPDVLIEASTGGGPLEHFEFPAGVINTAAAETRAKVRLEQLQRLAVVAEGRSHCVRFAPGRVIRIEGPSDDDLGGDHLIIEVVHEMEQSSRNVASGSPYKNRARMVPYGAGRTFRPDLPRRSPKIDGLETAAVTGPSGEEIWVDDLGSIKLRFRWDRSGIGDDKSSRWARTLQPNMLGAMILPRMGWEVPVAYLDGNPDFPVALGRLYNGGAPTPYGPGKKATTTLQSATSPGGGTTNEIRLADDAGSMEAFIHATKDQSIAVGGTQTTKVSGNETHDVKKSLEIKITGPQSADVGGNQSVVVGADMSVTVKGARAVSVGAMEHVKVTGTMVVECKGAHSELVGGAYGLQCNASNTVVQGAFTQMIGGSLATVAGLSTNRSCAAVVVEEVGGARTMTAAMSCADSVKGTKNVTAGASKDSAGTKVVTKVKGSGSVKAASGNLKAAGKLAVQAAKITIKAGGGITLKGGGQLVVKGKVKPKGSKLKFDASKTEKKATSKVGS